MKAVILEHLGETPRYSPFEDPDTLAGETLVEVQAAAIKQLDRLIAGGTHYGSPKQLPVVCGTDGVGRTADGRRVYFVVHRRPFGSMAERAPAAWTVSLPDGLDDALAAAVVNAAEASFLPLRRARLKPGETVMVLGATGASGRMTVRAARLLGAGRVIAAGRRQEALNALGADATIDLKLAAPELKAAFAAEVARGVDVIIDFVWGAVTEALIEQLVRSDVAPAGGGEIRLVEVGAMGGPKISLDGGALRGARLQIFGSGTGNYPVGDEMRTFVVDILTRAAKGEIDMNVARRPFSEVAEAWSAGEDGLRVVLTA